MISDLKPIQKRFLKAYLETSNLAESARRAGCICNSVSNYSNKGKALLNSLQLSFPEMLDLEGVTDQVIAQKTFEGLNANKTVFASYEGKFLDQKDCIDFANRAKYLELAGKFKGLLVERKELTGLNGGDIVLEVRPGARKEEKKLEIDID